MPNKRSSKARMESILFGVYLFFPGRKLSKTAKTIQELNDKKIPIVRIDNSLEKYKTMPIFQDKVDVVDHV